MKRIYETFWMVAIMTQLIGCEVATYSAIENSNNIGYILICILGAIACIINSITFFCLYQTEVELNKQ